MRMLIAASDLAAEPEIVQIATKHGHEVVRRCVDAVDLLAAASVEPELPMLVSAGLPRLDVSALAPYRAVLIASGLRQAENLPRAGIRSWISATETPLEIVRVFIAEVGDRRGVWQVHDPEDPAPLTRIIGVTCAAGSPGCTSTAIAIAKAQQHHTCLVDADVTDPSIAFRLGVVDDLSGIALALRHTTTASLTPRAVAASCAWLGQNRFLLSGHPGTSLHHSTRVISVAAVAFHTVVVDYGLFTDFPVPVDHRVVVMRAEDLSVARTLRLIRNYPNHLASATVAVTGLHARRTLSTVQRIFAKENLTNPIVDVRKVKAWSRALATKEPATQ